MAVGLEPMPCKSPLAGSQCHRTAPKPPRSGEFKMTTKTDLRYPRKNASDPPEIFSVHRAMDAAAAGCPSRAHWGQPDRIFGPDDDRSVASGIRSGISGTERHGVREAYAWQFLTATFLHISPWHLLGNMLILYMLGRDLESILGQRHFLYYIAGSIVGELGHLFLMPTSSVVYAASGGVAAVVVAYAAILPELELTALMFFVIPIRLKAKHLGTPHLSWPACFFASIANKR